MLTNYFKSTISTLALLGALSSFTASHAMEENEHSGGKAKAPTRGPSVSNLRKKFEQAPTQNSAPLVQKPVGAPKSVGTPKTTLRPVTGLKKLGVSPTYPLPQFSTKSSSTPSVVKRVINQNSITPTSVLPVTQPSRGPLPTASVVKRNASPKTSAPLASVIRPSREPLPVPPVAQRRVNPKTSTPQSSVTRPSRGPLPTPPGVKRNVSPKTTAPQTSVTRPSRGTLFTSKVRSAGGASSTTSSWAIEKDDGGVNARVPYSFTVAPIEQLPVEVVEHIFSFLPLESHDSVSLVSKTWQMLANDEKGAFGDLVAFEKACIDQKKELYEKTPPDLKHYGQTLSNLRKATQLLSHRPPAQQTWVVSRPFYQMEENFLPLHGILERDKEKDLRDIWFPLAFLRACDGFWTHVIERYWLEDEGEFYQIPRGMRHSFENHMCMRPAYSGRSVRWCSALTLLDSDKNLIEQFPKLTSEDDKYAFAIELCERGRESIEVVFDAGLTCASKEDWQSAAKFYTLALEKDPNFPAQYYVTAAGAYFNLQDWQSAAKYYTRALKKDSDLPTDDYVLTAFIYFSLENWEVATKYFTIALEKDPNFCAHVYLKAGYAAAKANQLEKAGIYFERFINDDAKNSSEIEALLNEEVLLYRILDVMEDVLKNSNSGTPFVEWIRLQRSKLDTKTKL